MVADTKCFASAGLFLVQAARCRSAYSSIMSARVKHDGTGSQLGRQDSVVSGRQSAVLGATTTPQPSNSQPTDNSSMPERRLPASTQQNDSASRLTQRPPSHRPPSTAGRCRRRAVRQNVANSYVDESLFGPVSDDMSAPSWQPKQRPVRPFTFDCTDYKAKAAADATNVPTSRPRSARSRPHSARLHHEPSFVDESLFGGDQLELSTWRAPWDKKDRRPKPLIFDATNYHEKQKHTDILAQRMASAKQRPPWR